MEVFFPVTHEERDALLGHAFTHAELAGLDHMGWENEGVEDDAVWVAAEVSDEQILRFEEPDSAVLGYRSFVFPGSVLNTLSWRPIPTSEVRLARQAERQRPNRDNLQTKLRAALMAGGETTALTTVARELLRQGIHRDELLAEMEILRAHLRDLDQERDEDRLMDVMDCVVGWCAPSAKIEP